ncbi:hypothetical protein [Cellulophaga lytica]|uniref:Uncharacterized protein n=2 Tax=Cellulophaga lytica TaxID=979 RepID=F0RFJ4_CELLC|nr:hypothetical protein [Cellulophaga lytica]ADY28942.1 hypothetical protein Celly_1113 [Cellulophaga lytica DSM 7489]WQG76883.1 hypothetical protein SR888_14435 [Cellulophaga lytica]
MASDTEIKLSSNWTNLGLYLGTIVVFIMIPILAKVTQDQDFHMGMIVAAAVFIALIGFIVYQFMYICDARVIGDKLVLKKKFRAAKHYPFDKIGYPKSFHLKRSKYTIVEMQNEDKSQEKYLIMNNRSLLSFESKDAEQTLIDLRNMAMRSK